MKTEDKKEFAAIIKTMFIGAGRQAPVPEATQLWWNCFKNDPIEDVRSGFGQAIAESTEFLMPGTVRKYMPDRSGFPDPETAWNHVPKSESSGAWVCSEMLAALGSCQDSIDRGDMIGGRVAFLEAYKRITSDAKRSGVAPKWFYSEAADLDRESRQIEKERATITAADRKWITNERAVQELEQLDRPISQEMKRLISDGLPTLLIGNTLKPGQQ